MRKDPWFLTPLTIRSRWLIVNVVDGILVMERLAGRGLYEVQGSGTFEELIPLYHQVGSALAKMERFASVPEDDPSVWQNPYTTDPYWNTIFEVFFDDVVNTSMANLARYELKQPELHRSIARYDPGSR